MPSYPGLRLAEQHDKAMAESDAPKASWHPDAAQPGPHPSAAYLGLQMLQADMQADEGPAAEQRDTGSRETVLHQPSMADLVRANDAVLVELQSRCTQLEAMGDRVLGSQLVPVAKACPRFPGDTVAARLWRQNSEMVETVERFDRALSRLKLFA